VSRYDNLAHPVTRLPAAKLTRKRSHASAVSSAPVFSEATLHDRIVVIILPLSRCRGKTLKTRVILNERSILLSTSSAAESRRGDERRRRHRPSWLSVEVFRTWTGYEAGFSWRVLHSPAVASASRREFFGYCSLPLPRSGSSTKRVSQSLLFEEEISQSNTSDLQDARASWSLLGKLPFEKLPRQLLPAVRMIPQLLGARSTTAG